MSKKTDQDDAREAALLAGTLPDEDRRAPEPAEVIPAPLFTVPSTPAGDDEFADAVAAHDVELERLLMAVENETGYAQKQAVTDLRKLLGRPKLREA